MSTVPETPDYSRTRRYAIQDACGASVMSGAGDAFIIPFAVALGATSLHIGYLSSIVGLLGAFSQVMGSRLVYHYRRRALVLTAVALQTLVWGFLGLLAFRAGLDPLQHAVLLLIVLYSFNAVSGAMGAPAWFSLMGDVVPATERGHFFGRRNAWSGCNMQRSSVRARCSGSSAASAAWFSACFPIIKRTETITRPQPRTTMTRPRRIECGLLSGRCGDPPRPLPTAAAHYRVPSRSLGGAPLQA